MVRNEIGRLGVPVKRIRPHTVRLLILIQLLNQLVELRSVLLPVDRSQQVNLPVQIDHVLRLVWKSKPLYHVAISKPLLIVSLFVQVVEGVPALRSNFKRAYVWFAAIRL